MRRRDFNAGPTGAATSPVPARAQQQGLLAIGRRDFITGLASTTVWPRIARTQETAVPVVGFLHAQTAETAAHLSVGFRAGLQAMGFVEGRNITILTSLAEGQVDRLPALAADFARRRVAVIVAAGGLPNALAAKAATATIPVIFEVGFNPVDFGLVQSFARPGGNLTGITGLNIDVVGKRLELLHELVPTAAAIALLVNPTNRTTETIIRDSQAAARQLGVRLLVHNVKDKNEIAPVVATLAQEQAGALMTSADPIFLAQCAELAAQAVRYQIPALTPFREFTTAGGLLSYGTDNFDLYYVVGVYAGRILQGEKPADLPVQQVTRLKLVANMKTAKTLGLTIPLTLRARADEVIE